MREEEKALAGLLYAPGDPELRALKLKAHNLNTDYNATYEHETDKRAAILRALLPDLGPGGFLQGPIYFHYGTHTHIGKNLFANFNFTVQDDAEVFIGDNCSFGPGVAIVTPLHPLLPDERRALPTAQGEKRLCLARPVHIGSDCWFGVNVTVCPGVTVGDGCVIGAGSVVTRDIPAHSLAVGVPCRVLRPLTEADSLLRFPELFGEDFLS